MDINEVLNNIKKPALRFYWTEEEKKNAKTYLDSYIGGVPYIEDVEDIRQCGDCGEKYVQTLQFLIPEKNKIDKKLYSLSYCFNCAENGNECNFQISVYQEPDEKKQAKDASLVKTLLTEKMPINYYVTYELPTYDYIEEVHSDVESVLFDMYGDDAFKVYTEMQMKYNNKVEDTGNSVFGLPKELVPSEIPLCPYTSEKMQPFLTISSDKKIGMNWDGNDYSMLIILKSPSHDYFQAFVI